MITSFEDISAKLGGGMRIDEADARLLASGRDIVLLGMLADEARRRRHGTCATFVRVLDIPVADRPVSLERSADAGELRIAGTPESLADAVAAVRAVRATAGATPVSGFSLVELEGLVTRSGEALATVLGALKDAGLEMIAEVSLDRLPAAERFLEVALHVGLPAPRATMHEPTDTDWVATCLSVVALQDRLGSLRAFAPLPRRLSVAQQTTGYEDIKRVALARLLVDNIETIQVDWTLHGPKLAQVTLTFGVDDVDSVSPVDDLSRGRRRAPLEEIRRSIQSASLVPAERNGRFELVTP